MALLVCLCGGWANRMLPLLSARRLVRMHGLDARFYWADQAEFDASFQDFFMADLQFGSWNDYKTDLHALGLSELYETEQPTEYLLAPVTQDSVKLAKNYQLVLTAKEYEMAAHDNSWSINSLPLYIVRALQREFWYLKPRPEIVRTVEEYATRFNINRDTVGVHIRRYETKIGTPDEHNWLSDAEIGKRMDTFIRLDQNQQFLLATDLNKWATWYLETYHDCVKMCERSAEPYILLDTHTRACLRRKDVLREALVELLLLSRCGYIVRNMASTYSQLAAIIGGIQTNY